MNNLEDEANYLLIYCSNVFKVDLNQLAKDNLSFSKKLAEANASNNIFLKGNTIYRNLKFFGAIRTN